MFAKIITPNTILLGEFDPDTHFNGEEYSEMRRFCQNHYPDDHKTMEDNYLILESTTNIDGDPWEIIRVPMPEPVWEEDYWVYRTYLNSQIFNDIIALPVYRELQEGETPAELLQMEKEAIQAYKEADDSYKIIPIRADQIIKYGGAIHCLTHEIPAEHPEESDLGGDQIVNQDSSSDNSKNEDFREEYKNSHPQGEIESNHTEGDTGDHNSENDNIENMEEENEVASDLKSQ